MQNRSAGAAGIHDTSTWWPHSPCSIGLPLLRSYRRLSKSNPTMHCIIHLTVVSRRRLLLFTVSSSSHLYIILYRVGPWQQRRVRVQGRHWRPTARRPRASGGLAVPSRKATAYGGRVHAEPSTATAAKQDDPGCCARRYVCRLGSTGSARGSDEWATCRGEACGRRKATCWPYVPCARYCPAGCRQRGIRRDEKPGRQLNSRDATQCHLDRR